VTYDKCACTSEDWECDYGYYRKIDGSDCVPLTSSFVKYSKLYNRMTLRLLTLYQKIAKGLTNAQEGTESFQVTCVKEGIRYNRII